MPSLVFTPEQNRVVVEARERLTVVLIRVGKADAVAFEELYRLTASKLMGISLRICGNRAAAEDVLQDVYLRVWNRASSFDPSRGSAIAWLAMIARNRSIDWLRTRSTQLSGESEETAQIADELPLALECMIVSADHLILLACLEGLEERQRDAIKAAFYGGATYADIARKQGVPLGTVKSWIRRGMTRLKTGLDVDPVRMEACTSHQAMRPSQRIEVTNA